MPPENSETQNPSFSGVDFYFSSRTYMLYKIPHIAGACALRVGEWWSCQDGKCSGRGALPYTHTPSDAHVIYFIFRQPFPRTLNLQLEKCSESEPPPLFLWTAFAMVSAKAKVRKRDWQRGSDDSLMVHLMRCNSALCNLRNIACFAFEFCITASSNALWGGTSSLICKMSL